VIGPRRWLSIAVAKAATFLLLLVVPPALAATDNPREVPKRRLFIALDAVPFQVVADLMDPALGEEALFQGYEGPTRLVSTFPSSTSVALPGILGPIGLEKSPGYEARFFDWQRRKVQGGGPVSYGRIEFPWREFFDWGRKDPVGSAFEAVRPIKSGSKRLRKAVDDFLRSDSEEFWIYIAATDIAAHVISPQALGEFFETLDGILLEARQASVDRPFDVVVFSDHGMDGGEPLVNVFKPVKKALKAGGFQYKKKLKGPGVVVLTPFGLVSNFETYTHEANKAPVAELLARVEGVDLCAYRLDEGWRVESWRGSATFRQQEVDGELWWSYEIHQGDPLELLEIIGRMEEAGLVSEGWLPDEAVFEASVKAEVPDPFYRIAHAFELVTNPASVVCSAGRGYMYGAPRTSALAQLGKGKLRWTHGALNREATLGFVFSDVENWQAPSAVRFDRAILPFHESASDLHEATFSDLDR
jgi:hypothetical protein